MKLCKRPSYWFDAVIEGDTKYIRNNIQNMKETYESRQSKNAIISGITALHYAIIYNQQEAFDILFPYEYHLLTDQQVVIQSQSTNLKAELPPGCSIIMLCIAGDRTQFLTKILEQIQANQQYQTLLGAVNDASQTALSLCPLYHNASANIFVSNELCIRFELKIRQVGNVNFIMQCASCLDENVLGWIINLLNSKCQGIVDEIKKQFTEKDERGYTFEQWIQGENCKQQLIDIANSIN